MNNTPLYRTAFTLAVIGLCAFAAFARHGNGTPQGFLENKGQVVDQHGQPRPDVRYLLPLPGLNVQLRTNGFSYDLLRTAPSEAPVTNADALEPTPAPASGALHVHRVDVAFVGGNPNATITGSAANNTVFNYYTAGTPEQGVLGVRSFSTVRYVEVWPHIDLEFSAAEGAVKWNVVVRPGGRVADISLRYAGAEVRVGSAGELVCTWGDGSLTERIPESTLYTGTERRAVRASYAVRADGTIGFSTDAPMIEGSTLVIDPVPTRIWGTYFGGSGEENAIDHATDANGNTYLAGTTTSTSALSTSGAHDVVHNGFFDVFLAKFNTNGARLWCTYYGGSNDETLGGVAVSAVTGNVALCGRTNSTGSMATLFAHQGGLAGGYDGFIALFTAAGARSWGTYYGGTSSDAADDVVFDAAGYPFVAGNTWSTSGIATAGASDITHNGLEDAFVVKFSAAGARQWATYMGGTSSDHVDGITCDNAWIFICGQTSSASGIATAGAHDVVYTGTTDAFLVKYANNGIKSWGTYYGGSGPTDWGMACLAEIGTGYVYLAGKTKSNDAIATPGAYMETPQENFLVRFNSACVRQWGTYVTGDQEVGLARAAASNIYMAGITQNTTGVGTPDAYDPTHNGGADVYVLKFTPGGSRLWGTYYGGENSDRFGGISCVSSTLWLSGYTYSAVDIATAGSFQPALNGTSSDAFLVKFTDTGVGMMLADEVEAEPLRMAVNADRSLVILPDAATRERAGDVRILDVAGRVVRAIAVNGDGEISCGELPAGVYVVVVQLGEERRSGRVVVP